jgi:hypothetical protein
MMELNSKSQVLYVWKRLKARISGYTVADREKLPEQFDATMDYISEETTEVISRECQSLAITITN